MAARTASPWTPMRPDGMSSLAELEALSLEREPSPQKRGDKLLGKKKSYFEMQMRDSEITRKLEQLDNQQRAREDVQGRVGLYYHQKFQQRLRQLRQNKETTQKAREQLVQRLDASVQKWRSSSTPDATQEQLTRQKMSYKRTVDGMAMVWMKHREQMVAEQVARMNDAIEESKQRRQTSAIMREKDRQLRLAIAERQDALLYEEQHAALEAEKARLEELEFSRQQEAKRIKVTQRLPEDRTLPDHVTGLYSRTLGPGNSSSRSVHDSKQHDSSERDRQLQERLNAESRQRQRELRRQAEEEERHQAQLAELNREYERTREAELARLRSRELQERQEAIDRDARRVAALRAEQERKSIEQERQRKEERDRMAEEARMRQVEEERRVAADQALQQQQRREEEELRAAQQRERQTRQEEQEKHRRDELARQEQARKQRELEQEREQERQRLAQQHSDNPKPLALREQSDELARKAEVKGMGNQPTTDSVAISARLAEHDNSRAGLEDSEELPPLNNTTQTRAEIGSPLPRLEPPEEMEEEQEETAKELPWTPTRKPWLMGAEEASALTRRSPASPQAVQSSVSKPSSEPTGTTYNQTPNVTRGISPEQRSVTPQDPQVADANEEPVRETPQRADTKQGQGVAESRPGDSDLAAERTSKETERKTIVSVTAPPSVASGTQSPAPAKVQSNSVLAKKMIASAYDDDFGEDELEDNDGGSEELSGSDVNFDDDEFDIPL